MALAMFAVCERVRLAMGAVSIVLCTLGGARSMEGTLDRVRRAIGSSWLAVGICCTGMACGFGMTTLGGDAGVRPSWGQCLGRMIEHSRMQVCESVVRGGFTCGGQWIVFHRWISGWSALTVNS